ncbi:hypothetical protein [uncultured Amnibacterium sp.]|uniref:hypothetical protein n=1 Tax=uncultured Amnibacterium sp. TaxID=1631851 RepID=UPI0035CB3074
MVREDAEALRRRLYAPGAERDDVDRYRAAGGGAEADSRRRTVGTLRAVAVLITAIVVVVVAIGVARTAVHPVPAGPAPTPLPVDAADRQGFEQNLERGTAAGIAAYLITTEPLPRFRRATRFDTIEDRGVGDGVVTLAPVDAAAARGRATVFLVVDVPAQVGWSTFRSRDDAAGEQHLVRQVHREGGQQPGIPTIHTYRYSSGNRPVELRVDAPDGVRWGTAVVFTD